MRTAWVWLLLLATANADAHADERSVARSAYRQATRHYELGEFDKALEAFKEAYRRVPDPVLLFDLGQCHRQMGDLPEAVRAYRMYVFKLPDGQRRSEVLLLIERLEHPAPSPAPERVETPPPAPAPPPPLLAPPQIIQIERHTPRPPAWLVFVTGGLTVAALVSATVLASRAQSLSNGERAKDPLLRDGQTADQIRLLSSSANGLFIGGGAALVATGALAFTANWRRRAKAQVVPTGNGLAVVGRF